MEDKTIIDSYQNNNLLLLIKKFSLGIKSSLITQTDPTGSSIRYEYFGDKLSSITDPVGRHTTFTYDGNHLAGVLYPDGTEQRFSYDSNGLMTSEVNKNESITQYVYNVWKRLSKVIRPDLKEINIQDFASTTFGNNFSSGNMGKLKTLGTGQNEAYDSIKDAKNIETKLVSDSTGYVTTIIDGEGRTTLVERDVQGRPTKITRPDQTEVSFTYDPITHDLVSKIASDTGIERRFVYDSFANLLEQNDAAGKIVRNEYDPNNGNLLRSIDQLGQISSANYNELGLPVTKTNPQGQVVTFNYDIFGNLIKSIDPEGASVQIVRDSAGNIAKVINAKGEVTEKTYDEWNRLATVKTPNGKITSYEYDHEGNLVKIFDPENHVTSFEYNLLGQLIKKTDVMGKINQMSYDENGNLASETHPGNSIFSYQYNNLDQLVKKVLPDNQIEISYNSRGKVTTLSDHYSKLDYTYKITEAGDLIASETITGLNELETWGESQIVNSYDESGNRIRMNSFLGTTNYEYDDLNRLEKLTDFNSRPFTYSYDAASRITKVSRIGSETLYNFDAANFISSIVHKKLNSNNLINRFEYSKDGNANKTLISNLQGKTSFEYDPQGQITKSNSEELNQTETFSYDDLGNRTTDQNGSYTYDSKKQQLSEDYQFIYAYDMQNDTQNQPL